MRAWIPILTLLSACSAGAAPPQPRDYRAEARTATDYIQRTFWDPQACLYRPAVPPEPHAPPFDFTWANGVQLSVLVAAAEDDPKRYRPVLEAFFRGLDRYWDSRAPIPAYDAYWSHPGRSDKYYDDNAWMAIALTEAYRVTYDRRYLDRAEAALSFVLSGWDDRLGGGIYWREDHRSKNTCSNAPAAFAALVMARYRHREEYVGWAKRIVEWTCRTLQAPDGTFWDHVDLDGKVERMRWTYNTALMLRADLGLYRETSDESRLREAQRLARVSTREFTKPATGAFRDDALFSHLLVEALLDLYRQTHEEYLLRAARRNAEFACTVLRDPAGGFWNAWKAPPGRHEARKLLMANAATARLLWVVGRFDEDPRVGRRSSAARVSRAPACRERPSVQWRGGRSSPGSSGRGLRPTSGAGPT